jgi:hypothetical protein
MARTREDIDDEIDLYPWPGSCRQAHRRESLAGADRVPALSQSPRPSFVRLREQIWLSVFEAAAKDGFSTIFTFAPESTVNPGFIEAAVAAVQNAGGEVCFVKLDCPIDILEQRMEDASRSRFLKLNSVAVFRELRAKGADHFPELPPGLTIDTSTLEPSESARRICEHFQLPILSMPPVIEHFPKG